MFDPKKPTKARALRWAREAKKMKATRPCGANGCYRFASRQVTVRRGQETLGVYCRLHAGEACEAWNKNRRPHQGPARSSGIGSGR